MTELAEQFIRGMNAVGMPATLKHFPGHGSCVLDSHVDKPVDDQKESELDKDLYPFKTLIAKPDLNFAIMTAHVTYPAESDHTAGYSKKWVEGILRGECQYQRLVVMSDCLSMEGAGVGAALIDRLKAAGEAGNIFKMFTHQHNTEKDNKLDQLLAVLDQIPDNKTSAERREKLALTIQRRSVKLDVAVGAKADAAQRSDVSGATLPGFQIARAAGTGDAVKAQDSSKPAAPKPRSVLD